MKSITVGKLLKGNKDYHQISGDEESLKREIFISEVNRPGFELAVFLNIVILEELLFLVKKKQLLLKKCLMKDKKKYSHVLLIKKFLVL